MILTGSTARHPETSHLGRLIGTDINGDMHLNGQVVVSSRKGLATRSIVKSYFILPAHSNRILGMYVMLYSNLRRRSCLSNHRRHGMGRGAGCHPSCQGKYVSESSFQLHRHLSGRTGSVLCKGVQPSLKASFSPLLSAIRPSFYPRQHQRVAASAHRQCLPVCGSIQCRPGPFATAQAPAEGIRACGHGSSAGSAAGVHLGAGAWGGRASRSGMETGRCRCLRRSGFQD
jgi:hypothetical protein